MKIILFSLLLSACAMTATPELVYKNQNIPYPTLDSFPHCRSYGCAKVDTVSLNETEQTTIKLLFETNENAEQERQNIQQAIATFEAIIGARTGTHEDKGGTYVQLGHMQQDCVDESTNTTTYLVLLDQMKLLQLHYVNALTSRFPILAGQGPHRTAVITDKTTGHKYAIDSWFHDNGVEPEIITLDVWRWGWHPE